MRKRIATALVLVVLLSTTPTTFAAASLDRDSYEPRVVQIIKAAKRWVVRTFGGDLPTPPKPCETNCP